MTSTLRNPLSLAALRLKNRHAPVSRRGERVMAGLEDEAEVVVDRWGVPHVYARTFHDLFFLNGYVQAWDRLWQMDFSRRVACGRLAEVLGSDALPLDRFTRRVGFARRAAEAIPLASGETRTTIEAFVDGVNAFIEDSVRLPFEFQALVYRPEPWTASDVVAVSMLVPFSLTPNWDIELVRSLLLERHSPEDLAALEIDHRADYGSASTTGVRAAPIQGSHEVLAEFKRLTGLGRGGGSNAWVLSGKRTATGKPILAGDPHLPASLPNIWHQVHLSAGDIDVIGASVAGIPGVIIGHNRRCAWSVTAGVVDTSDLFVGNGDVQTIRETIEVRDSQPVIEEVHIGENGPDVAPALGVEGPLFLKIVLPDADGLIGALVGIARAADWTEFREALRGWKAPVLNFVYADTSGDIGYQLAGQIPIRDGGKGLLPSPNGEGEWTGFIPFEELPTALNPESGYLITANHRPAADDYPHWLGVDFVDGSRALRIGELIDATEKHSPLDVSRMQMDVLSPAAREICGALSGLAAPDLETSLQTLRVWDHRLTPESAEACLYSAFVREFARRLAKRRLGDDHAYWMGKFMNPVSQSSSWDFNHAAKVAELLATRPAGWFEDWDREIAGALRDAESILADQLGPDRTSWRYGNLHALKLNHSLGSDRLAPMLNRGPYQLGGDGQCVNANSHAPEGPFDATYIPGFRHVVDLSDTNEGHAVMSGGQSGDPFSTHYNDLTRLWLNGQMHRQYFARTDVVRHSESTLRLLPDLVGRVSGR